MRDSKPYLRSVATAQFTCKSEQSRKDDLLDRVEPSDPADPTKHGRDR